MNKVHITLIALIISFFASIKGMDGMDRMAQFMQEEEARERTKIARRMRPEQRPQYSIYIPLSNYSTQELLLLRQAQLSEKDHSFAPFNNIVIQNDKNGMGRHAFACEIAHRMGMTPRVLACDTLAFDALETPGMRDTYKYNPNAALLSMLRFQLKQPKEIIPEIRFIILDHFSEFLKQMKGDLIENLTRTLQTITDVQEEYQSQPHYYLFCVTKLDASLNIPQAVTQTVPSVFWVKLSEPNVDDKMAILQAHLKHISQNFTTKPVMTRQELQNAVADNPTIAQLVQRAKQYKLEADLVSHNIIDASMDSNYKGKRKT